MSPRTCVPEPVAEHRENSSPGFPPMQPGTFDAWDGAVAG